MQQRLKIVPRGNNKYSVNSAKLQCGALARGVHNHNTYIEIKDPWESFIPMMGKLDLIHKCEVV